MYKLTHTDEFIKRSDGAFIQRPIEGGYSPEWEKYEQWLAQGNTPAPADPLPVAQPVAAPIDNLKADLAALLADPEAKAALKAALS